MPDLRQIEVRADYDLVAITIQSGPKDFVALFRFIENDIEHDQPGTRLKEAVEQKPPKFSRPWVTVFAHQLQRTIVRPVLFFRFQRQAGLIDSEKNKIIMRFGFAAFAPQHIGKTAFAAPNDRKKRRGRKKMGQRNQACPKSRDQAQYEQPMAMEPMHGRIISEIRYNVKSLHR